MDMDPQILIELTKIISEQNENPVRIEKNLVQKNPPKDKTRSYNVQLGSSTLILSKTNNSQLSEAEHQKFLDQLDHFERQKKLYYQILETEEPLTSSKYGISVRGGELGKSGPGPRAKADALKNARKTGGGSIFAQSFTPQRQYCSRPINKPLSCRNNVKIKDDSFNPNHSDRFDKLSKNPETNQIDRKSRTEAITILQAENKGIVNNARRPNLENGEPNLDFVIDGPGPYKYVDVKNLIDPRKYSSAKKKPESFNKIAKRIGEKIRKQKGGSNDVLHIVDLEKLPPEIKANFTQKVIESAGRPNGIEFIN